MNSFDIDNLVINPIADGSIVVLTKKISFYTDKGASILGIEPGTIMLYLGYKPWRGVSEIPALWYLHPNHGPIMSLLLRRSEFFNIFDVHQ